ncbi:hypothetical protein [Bacillus sp. 1P06AnD]|uniref:hypothetical protein n=1 Tax=Bacillus sp. 1P06AnD TaxID=3132208 RepID=UPI0039A277D7
MRPIYLFNCFMGTLIFSSFLCLIHQNIKLEQLENEFTKNFQRYDPIPDYIKYNSITYDFGNITVNFTSTDRFESISNENKFVYLNCLHRLLHTRLKHGSNYNPLYQKKIKLLVQTKDTVYTYKNTFPYKTEPFTGGGVLTFNSTCLTEKKVNHLLKTNPSLFKASTFDPFLNNVKSNYDFEMDVINYLVRVFNLTTKKYRDINVTQDAMLAAESTMENFNLTKKEFNAIYTSWFFPIFTDQENLLK